MTWKPPTSPTANLSSDIDSAWMGVNNNGRKAMGTSALSEFKAASASNASPLKEARLKGTAPGGPMAGAKGTKTHIINEHLGPSLVPKATKPAQSQESQKTLANTRWVKGSGF